MTTTLPTVDELNKIQDEWMALESTAPEAEKRRVFKLMETLPSVHLSVNSLKTAASFMVDSMPIWSAARPLEQALAYADTWNAAHPWRQEVPEGRRMVRQPWKVGDAVKHAPCKHKLVTILGTTHQWCRRCGAIRKMFDVHGIRWTLPNRRAK